MGALTRLQLLTFHPTPIDSIRDITGTEKTLKNQQHLNSW